MKKNFFLMAMLLIASFSFAAAPEVTYDFTNSEQNWGMKADKDTLKVATTYTDGTLSYTVEAGSIIRFFHQTNSGQDYYCFMAYNGAVINFPAFDFKVDKIIITGSEGEANGSHKQFFVGDEAASNKITKGKGEQVFVIDEKFKVANTAFTLKCTNGNAQMSKIEIYKVNENAPKAPTFDMAEGAYLKDIDVTIASVTEGADIFYTLDGTDPTAASTKYAAPVKINAGKEVTIKAIAIKDGEESDIVSATYNVVITEGDGSYENPFSAADVLALNNKLVIPEDQEDKDQWVVAYILGGAKKSGDNYVIDNTVASAIIVADAKDEEDMTKVIGVQLEGNSKARTALNPVDNADIAGTQVKLKGSLEAYNSLPGLKGVGAEKDYEILTEEFKRPVYYTLTIEQPAEGGTISADKSGKVAAGATVTLSATPADEYGLEKYIVTKEDKTEVAVTDNTFLMPEANVTVTASFVKAAKHKITIAAVEHGKVVATPAEATKGTTIVLTITPDADYVLDAVKVEDADNKAIEVKDNKFAMPDADVTVTVTFKAYSYTLAQFMAEQPSEPKKITEDLTIAFNSGDNSYATNGTLFICVYDKGSALVKDVKNGSVLKGITGKFESYNGVPEIIPTAAPTVEEGKAVAAQEITAAPTAADVCKLVSLKEQHIDKDALVFGSVKVYDQFKLNEAIVAGTWSFEAIVSIYKEAVQLLPTTVLEGTPDSDALDNVEISLDINAPMYNILGQPVDANYKGIVIQNGKKFMLR